MLDGIRLERRAPSVQNDWTVCSGFCNPAVVQRLGRVVQPHLAVGLCCMHCIGDDVADVDDFLPSPKGRASKTNYAEPQDRGISVSLPRDD